MKEKGIVIYTEHTRGKWAGQDPYERDSKGNILNPSLTKQEMSEECDINKIIQKYVKTGSMLPGLIKQNPSYGDFSQPADFQKAFDIVQLAEEQFSALDGRIRARFENDPHRFLEFVHNPANAEELVEMGLAIKREEKKAPDTVPAQKTPAGKPKAEAGDKP